MWYAMPVIRVLIQKMAEIFVKILQRLKNQKEKI